MCSNLSYHKLRIVINIFYISLILTTKKKNYIDTGKRKRKDSKHATTENGQITEEKKKNRE